MATIIVGSVAGIVARGLGMGRWKAVGLGLLSALLFLVVLSLLANTSVPGG